MRIVTINDRKIKIRPLTRKEVKSLSDCGFGAAVFSPTVETINDAHERIMAMVLTPEELEWMDDQPNNVVQTIWRAVLNETYGAPEETKNSSGTSDGTLTQNG